MEGKREERVILGISAAGFLLLAISFLLMPIEKLKVLPGVLFWCSLIIGITFQIVLNVRCKALLAADKANRKKMRKKRCGMLTLCANRWARIADIALAVSLAATLLTLIITKGYGYFCFVCIAVLVYSFCMHCILNGKNYAYLIEQKAQSQPKEGKTDSVTRKGERK